MTEVYEKLADQNGSDIEKSQMKPVRKQLQGSIHRVLMNWQNVIFIDESWIYIDPGINTETFI